MEKLKKDIEDLIDTVYDQITKNEKMYLLQPLRYRYKILKEKYENMETSSKDIERDLRVLKETLYEEENKR